MKSLLDEVQDLFRTVFLDDQLILTESTTAFDVEGWDSLMHINLIIALEKRFEIKFAMVEISRLNAGGSNIGTLLQLLKQKCKS